MMPWAGPFGSWLATSDKDLPHGVGVGVRGRLGPHLGDARNDEARRDEDEYAHGRLDSWSSRPGSMTQPGGRSKARAFSRGGNRTANLPPRTVTPHTPWLDHSADRAPPSSKMYSFLACLMIGCQLRGMVSSFFAM